MKILLDTHILLWMAWDKKDKFSSQVLELLEDPNNELYFSLASLWEISIKSSLGKPDFDVDVSAFENGLVNAGFRTLPITLAHILKQSELPLIHRDPFDRMLIAQAEIERLFFLTADNIILQYHKPFIMNAS
ncbi:MULTISPECIES: type II toxin-antitoxin system VapC family toxin [unclassified Mannheimia]|uniref:type II toxin-antitoxin system VapC family toxin n=1 Tax=unclassified Mannheimia TaxID=2645054 RepID=UPI00359DA843